MAKNIVASQLGPQEMEAWKGLDIFDADKKKLGKLKDVYLDETSNTPKWGLTSIGLLGAKELFVPLGDAVRMDDGIHIKIKKEQAENAPQFSAVGEIKAGDEAELAKHYGLKRENDSSGKSPDPDEMPIPETKTPPDNPGQPPQLAPGETLPPNVEINIPHSVQEP